MKSPEPRRLVVIISWLAERRDAIRLSPTGKAIAGGLVTIAATGTGTIVAEELGKAIGSQVAVLAGGTLAAAKDAGHLAAFYSALASGITGGGSSVMAVARADRLRTTVGLEFLHMLKAGFRAVRTAKLAAIAASFLGGSFAAVGAVGFSATIGAGAGGLAASPIGAVITIGLAGMLDYSARAARARARKARADRRLAK